MSLLGTLWRRSVDAKQRGVPVTIRRREARALADALGGVDPAEATLLFHRMCDSSANKQASLYGVPCRIRPIEARR